MNEDLKSKSCKPCRGDEEPLKGEALEPLRRGLSEGWRVEEEHHLVKRFTFDDFQQALDFTQRAGNVAEQENHHPVITLTWGRVDVKIWSHKIDGLTENDFILAAKIDEVG
jgi:4a-hydroxytetrahydrobiopterin dehydratase